MSHELRTPLNTVLGFSKLMFKASNLTDKQRKRINTIVDSGNHLLTLINDVLDLAKIEAGHVTLDRQVFDVRHVVSEVSDMMLSDAKNKGVKLEVDKPSEIPHFVKGDEGKLRQVLINLVDNAIKHTDVGFVSLRVTSQPVKESGWVRMTFEIEDTGKGIEEENIALIFEPFTQAEQQHANKGTGLGLAITQRNIEVMGGTISVESIPGKGSLFCFEVPLRAATEPSTNTSMTQWGNVVGLVPGTPSPLILVVDDNVDNRLLLRDLLEPMGFELLEVSDGSFALAEIEKWQPNFIWMDIRMPGMDGLETIRQIRKMEAGKNIKIAVLSAHAFDEDHENAIAAGCDDFVRKPFREEEIFETLNRHLELSYIFEDPSW